MDPEDWVSDESYDTLLAENERLRFLLNEAERDAVAHLATLVKSLELTAYRAEIEARWLAREEDK
jgi:hypothetical protein